MKKFISILSAALFSVLSIHALPGFKPSVKDLSGNYVYYRDTTFERNSYVGFLCYDDKTFAARYVSPEDKKTNLSELSVTVYFTVNPAADHMELTGEKIISQKTPDDTEIINYLHDMIYELNARRIKAGSIEKSESINEDFMQFGGGVSVRYNPRVPLFNIESVTKDGEARPSFYAVTQGTLVSEFDPSFTDFTGIPSAKDTNSHKIRLNKKAQHNEFKIDEFLTCSFDSNWEQKIQNAWFCGDSAVISICGTNIPAGSIQSEENIRRLLITGDNTYILSDSILVSKENNCTTLNYLTWTKADGNISRVFKNLFTNKNGTVYYSTMSVYESIYQKNKNYFDSVFNGIRAE